MLFESNLSENHKVVQGIIKDLTNEGKTVVAYGYVPKKKALTPSRLDFTLLDNEKTNCLLRPEKTVLEKIAGEQYDLLIDLTLRQVVPIDYILVSANAKCKTGKKKTETSLTDFQIDIPKRKALPDNEIDLNFCEERLLFDQIIFILNKLQPNKIKKPYMLKNKLVGMGVALITPFKERHYRLRCVAPTY